MTIYCLNEIEAEKRYELIFNGHITSVRDNLLQIICLTCRKSFYPYTSRNF